MIAYRYSQNTAPQESRPLHLEPDSLLKALSRQLMQGNNLSTAMEKFKWEGLIDLDNERVHGLAHMLEQVRELRRQLLETWSLEGILEDIAISVRGFLETSPTIAQCGQVSNDSLADEMAALEAVRDWIDHRFPDDLARWMDVLIRLAEPSPSSGPHFKRLYAGLLYQVSGLKYLLKSDCQPDSADIEVALDDLQRLMTMGSGGGSGIAWMAFAANHSHLFEIGKDLHAFAETALNRRKSFKMLMMSMPYRLRLALESFLEPAERTPAWISNLEQLWHDLENRVRMAPPKKMVFQGVHPLGLDPALAVMEKLWKLEELEKTILRGRIDGDLSAIKNDLLGELLGELAVRSFERLSRIADILIEGGYLFESSCGYSLTSKALRRIGEFALRDVFRRSCRRNVPRRIPAGHAFPDALVSETKKYEYGDALHLDVSQTLLSAVKRSPRAAVPLPLLSEDFEVYVTERSAKTSTVLLLDMSSSMEQAFPRAKQVALSLSRLLEKRFPNDKLGLVGVYTLAQALSLPGIIRMKTQPYFAGHVNTTMKYQELKRLQKADPLSFPADFTNLQEGLRLCRRQMEKDRHYEKHIFLITDGVPTACIRNGWVHLESTPSPVVLRETLREVHACTRNAIRITVFMLASDNHIPAFVETMVRINKSRVVITSPEGLPECVLVDFLSKKVRAAAQ